MRAFRWVLAGWVGCALTIGSASVLSGCGDDTSTTGSQVQESKESKDENQRIMDAMKKNMEASKPSKKK